MNVQSGKRGRGRPAQGDKQRRILDAALALFAERGFHGTAVPLVAEAAGVATGTIYHYFANKEALVNAVFRDAKARLRVAVYADLDSTQEPEALFREVWRRLATFARADPVRFRFLELQDHVPYLDAESREFELNVLVPLWLAGRSIASRGGARDMPVEALMALVWGALVGLIKAERLGYIQLDDDTLARAGEACWRATQKS